MPTQSPALPLLVEASGWGGNDGNYSTFRIGVGSPRQDFEVLPATGHGDIWVPVSEGCASYGTASALCGASRGVGVSNGTQGDGFMINGSSTWDQLGIYELASVQNLYGTNETGLYGLDTMVIGPGSSHVVPNQTIAGIATSDFWLGSMGLGPATGNFPGLGTVPSFLSALKSQNLISSMSFGFTPGASYRAANGSLTLGGYDQARIATTSSLQAPVSIGARPLGVTLRSLVATNTLQGTQAIPVGADGLSVDIDSSVSYLSLPQAMCDALAQAFGLAYDSSTDLYLVNSTAQGSLASNSPVLTFTLAANASSTQTTNIVFPYSAFNLTFGPPLYNTSTPYFPMRRAAGPSQFDFILGRSFLQEAYLIVDWERSNFTLGQALHPEGTLHDIVPILAPSHKDRPASKLGGGAIGGIVVGCVGVLVAVAVVRFIVRRRRRRILQLSVLDSNPVIDEKKLASSDVENFSSTHQPGRGRGSDPLHELHDTQVKAQLMSTPIFELPGEAVELEMASASAEDGHKAV